MSVHLMVLSLISVWGCGSKSKQRQLIWQLVPNFGSLLQKSRLPSHKFTQYSSEIPTTITRPNCALDRRKILCLYVPGFQRQIFEHVPKCK